MIITQPWRPFSRTKLGRRPFLSICTLYFPLKVHGVKQFRSDVHTRAVGSTSHLPIQTDLLERYRALVTLGRINYDEEQIRAIMKLRRLQKELIDYAPPAHSASLLNPHSPTDTEKPWWLFSEREIDLDKSGKSLVTFRGYAEELGALETPKGLLLTGPPGSGKSFLVDLWFESVPTPYKTRKHYSGLVLEIYRGVWEETQRRINELYSHKKPIREQTGPWNKNIRENMRQLLKIGSLPIRWGGTKTSSVENVDPTISFMVARRLLLRHWLLAFDEVQLLDVSSANLLADVLSWYWRMGGVIVGTSNKVPDDLYRGGVQREHLEPFVETLKIRCPVLILDGKKDWRQDSKTPILGGRSWYTSDQKAQYEDALSKIFPGGEATNRELRVFGRPLSVPLASGLSCKFSFSELCNRSLGPADYLTIASHFSVIAITDIPILPLASKDQARRFISLIDAFYESRCRIICLAETTPDKLFFPDAASSKDVQVDMMMAESVSETQDVYRPNVSSYDKPQMREAPAAPKVALSIDSLSIFSGEEEQFAFKRALSRLSEMISPGYNRANQWSPLPLNDRKWETDLRPTVKGSDMSMTATLEPRPEPPRPGSDDAEDFANEASYEAVNPFFKRPQARVLSPNHVWGVREDWGPRAKDWGQGAQIHRRGGKGDD